MLLKRSKCYKKSTSLVHVHHYKDLWRFKFIKIWQCLKSGSFTGHISWIWCYGLRDWSFLITDACGLWAAAISWDSSCWKPIRTVNLLSKFFKMYRIVSVGFLQIPDLVRHRNMRTKCDIDTRNCTANNTAECDYNVRDVTNPLNLLDPYHYELSMQCLISAGPWSLLQLDSSYQTFQNCEKISIINSSKLTIGVAVSCSSMFKSFRRRLPRLGDFGGDLKIDEL